MNKPRYVVKDTDRHGNDRWYLRVPRRGKVRLTVPPGDEGFDSALVAAFQKLPPERRRQQLKPDSRTRGFVYFLRAGGSIKIGFSANPFRRVDELKTGISAPVDAHVIVRGTVADERRLHRLLNKHRLSGEWFRDHAEVVGFMGRAAFVANIGDVFERTNAE